MALLALAPTTLPESAPIEYVEAAAAAGYDGVGLRLCRSPLFPFFPVAGDSALIREIKRRLAESGLMVLTDFDGFRAPLEVGAELGARYALVLGDDPEWTRLRDSFDRFCGMAAPFGISAAIEFAAQRPLSSLTQALRLMAEVRRDNAVVCVDPFNLIRSGGRVEMLEGVDPRLFPYAQISDGVVEPGEEGWPGVGERRLPGEGTLPLREILAALPAGVPLSVEVPCPRSTPMPARAWATRVAERTRAFLALP